MPQQFTESEGSISHLRIEKLAPGGHDARALPILASQNLHSSGQTGCQVGEDCNSPTGELLSAPWGLGASSLRQGQEGWMNDETDNHVEL
jgi:hypothetical protein